MRADSSPLVWSVFVVPALGVQSMATRVLLMAQLRIYGRQRHSSIASALP